MGFLDSLFKSHAAPLPAPAIRETLFGDMSVEQWPPDDSSSEASWKIFIEARQRLAARDSVAASRLWQSVLDQPALDPRHYLQAWHFLRSHGVQSSADKAKQVLGVVVEVALKEGLDLLAGYRDRSARYYNHSGAAVVWEHPDESLDGPIDRMLAAASVIASRIGPWSGPRPPVPSVGQVRLSFLTPSGIHFGEATWDTFTSDPAARAVLQAAAALMQALTAKVDRSERA